MDTPLAAPIQSTSRFRCAWCFRWRGLRAGRESRALAKLARDARTPDAACYHRPMPVPRRFPPPWSLEERQKSFIVKGANGQQIAYLYFEDEPQRQMSTSGHRLPASSNQTSQLNGLSALIYLCWKWLIEFNADCVLRSPNY
jgi:hypothetical protein